MGCFIFGGGGIGGNGGVPFDQVTMEPQFGLAGKKFIDKNKQLKTGTIQNWNGTLLTHDGSGDSQGSDEYIEPALFNRYIPAGYYIGKDIDIRPMPEGSVNVEFLNPYSYAIEKTAGYINGTTETVMLPEGKMLIDTNNSPTSYALDHTYAAAANKFYAIAMTEVAAYNVANTFLITAFAHGSVSNGEIAAFTLLKENGAWGMIAYKMGDYPKYIGSSSLSVEYIENEVKDGILVEIKKFIVTLLTNSYGHFSTSKYYEGFGLYL